MNSPDVSRLGKAWQSLADRENTRIRDLFIQNPQAGAGSRVLAAYLLLAGVLVLYGLTLLGGLWLAGQTIGLIPGRVFPAVVCGFFALLLLAAGWLARPRFYPLQGQPLNAQTAPALHALVSEMAQALEVPAARAHHAFFGRECLHGTGGPSPEGSSGNWGATLVRTTSAGTCGSPGS